MFVLKSTYEVKVAELQKGLAEERAKLGRLNSEYTRVVLDNASLRSDNTHLRRQLHDEGNRFNNLARSQSSAFTDADLKQLIALCHPDKHGGNKVANEITAKLIKMRKK